MNKPKLAVLAAILLTSGFLRLWHVPENLYFMIDEGRDAFMMKRIYLDHQPMLVGGAIPGGIYLGAGYQYVTGLLMLLFKFNPIKLGYTASILGVLATVGIYLLIKKTFDSTTALIATAIYLFSYLINIYDRIFWPLTWSSLSTLITYWGLYQIIKHHHFKYLYLLTAVYILGSHSDASYISLIITSIVVLWHYRPQGLKSISLISLGGFLLFQSPLVIFDLRHQFHNTKLLLKFFSFSSDTVTKSPSLNSLIKALLIFPKTLSRIFYIPPPYDVTFHLSPSVGTTLAREASIPSILIFITTIFLLVFLLKRWRKTQSLPIFIIKTHLLVSIFGVIAYSLFFPGYTHEWFLIVLFPNLVIVAAIILRMLLRHNYAWIVLPTLALFVFYNSQAVLQSHNSFGFAHKAAAVNYAINQVGQQSFYLDSLGSQAYGGYRYLFWLYGKEPTHSYMDNIYGNWVYPMPPEKKPTDLGVIFVNLTDYESDQDKQIAANLRQQAQSAQKFAGIEVLIIPH